MGQGKRVERVKDLMLEVVYEVIRDIKDPRVSSAMVSFNHVKVSPDLGSAIFYVSVLTNRETLPEVVEGLNRASGFIRREVFKKVRMKKVPSFQFIADNSIDRIGKVMDLLGEANKSEEQEPEGWV